MSFTAEEFGGHPVAEFLLSAKDDAAKLADTPLWPLADDDVADLVTFAAQLESQVAALKLRLIVEADGRGVAGRAGAPSTQAWLRGASHCTPSAGKGQVRLAAALEALPGVARALSDGRISTAHARVIAAALKELPPGEPETQQRAEAHLVEQAGRFDPHQVAQLGRRIFEVVDPVAADAKEAEKLAELEKRAWRRRELTFTPDGRGRLDVEAAAVVRRAIDPLAKPRPGDDGRPDLRSHGARVADALTEVCRRALVSGELPVQRGERPQIVVTIDHTKLRDMTGAGTLDTGERLSPAVVRRVACDAEVIPAVLGGESHPLDLGRRERLFTPAQRRALILRDGGCAFPSCDRPPAWKSDLHNGVLLCGFHHREIHKGHWIVRIDAGQPVFVPPKYVDPEQRPIRERKAQPT
jgi:hypothetical protein